MPKYGTVILRTTRIAVINAAVLVASSGLTRCEQVWTSISHITHLSDIQPAALWRITFKKSAEVRTRCSEHVYAMKVNAKNLYMKKNLNPTLLVGRSNANP